MNQYDDTCGADASSLRCVCHENTDASLGFFFVLCKKSMSQVAQDTHAKPHNCASADIATTV
jgi:hypothetical protein